MSHCFQPAKILLPGQSADLTKWACVACDQFTSQPAYWQAAAKVVGDAPSTLNIILPELYLEQPGVEERIQKIHTTMDQYAKTILTRQVNGFVYLERTMQDGSVRSGLLGAVDLEAYSFDRQAQPPIRPSESTVVSRIPPRLAVRRGASLESPHVMMLADDDACTLIEPVAARKNSLPKLYEGDLMLGGGHIAGWAVEDPALIQGVLDALETLGSQESFDQKYPQGAGRKPLTLAVGDGNHSLATAKAYWEELKAALPPEQWESHPARWCLAELVNVHSPALQMEPIHRVIFGATPAVVLKCWQAYCKGNGVTLKVGLPGEQNLTMTAQGQDTLIGLDNPAHPLTVGSLETFIEELLQIHPEFTVDYIHGVETARELAAGGGVAFLLPDFEKSDLFKGVVMGGVLPRKTFSMGHAEEKRYYLECRSLLAQD